MSTVAEINQRIAVAKAESKRINDLRQVNIGKKQALEAQLSTALAQYKADFGVDLTPETLKAEIDRVTVEKEQEVSRIEQMLSLINQGKYDEAQAIANPDSVKPAKTVDTQPQTVVAVEPVVAPQVAQSVVAPQVAQPQVTPVSESVSTTPTQVAETSVNTGITPPVVEPQVAQPEVSAPPTEVVGAPPTAGVQPQVAPTQPQVAPIQPQVAPPSQTKMNLTGIDALEDFDTPAPPVHTEPKPVNTQVDSLGEPPITSFSAILGGSQFAPNTGV